MPQVEIKLYDTGQGSALAKTTALPNERRAGFNGTDTVNPFTLNFTTYTGNGGGAIFEEPALITRNEGTRLSRVSGITYRNPVFVLNCVVNKNEISDSGYEHSWFYQLMLLERTKGVKLLYFTGNSSARYKTMLESYGQYYYNGTYQSDINTLQGTSSLQYSYIPVIVKSVGNITDNANNDTIRFDITCRIAGQ